MGYRLFVTDVTAKNDKLLSRYVRAHAWEGRIQMKFTILNTTIVTTAIACLWCYKNVGFHPSFSRHGITRASSVLLIWLNENVGFHPSFSRHGITRASSVLLIWLNENVPLWCATPHSLQKEQGTFLRKQRTSFKKQGRFLRKQGTFFKK